MAGNELTDDYAFAFFLSILCNANYLQTYQDGCRTSTNDVITVLAGLHKKTKVSGCPSLHWIWIH